ncbi:MAG: MATE family efflux transporter, partial [Clostridia bacterium]|nr:MATE family efflux transporter [Clostridia bacterium]
MDTKLQSDVLSVNAIRRVMPSCCVYALVQSMTFMVDTILAGHFIGSNAVAAVAMGMPIIGLMLAFTSMILHGGYLKMLFYMGRSDMNSYQRMFSITLTLTILIDLIFVGICMAGTGAVAKISGGAIAEAQSVALAHIYIRTASPMIFFFAVGTVFQLVSASFGYQTDRMISSLVNVVVNIVVSLTAIYALEGDMKIAGLGIGSAAGAFSQLVVAYVQVKIKKINVRYKLYPINKQNVLDSLDCFKEGLPASVDTLLDSVSGSVVNNIILAVFANGTAVMALVAIIKTTNTLVRTAGRGAMYASEPLIGILHGGRDNDGICKTFIAAIKWGVIYASVVAAVFIVFQSPILSFYGVAQNPDARIGLILIAVSGIVSVFMFTLNSAYEGTHHMPNALIISVIPDSVMYPLFVLLFGKMFGVNAIWVALGYSFIPFFVIYYIVFMLINRRLVVPMDRLLLLKRYENRDTALDVSIPIETEHVSFVSETLQSFFLSHNTPSRIAFFIALCMEEIAADYLEYKKNEGAADKKEFMDIKAFRDEDKIEIVLRNYDEPYNPLVFERDEESFSKIGVSMVQKIASKISYSYAYHLNVVSVTIPC